MAFGLLAIFFAGCATTPPPPSKPGELEVAEVAEITVTATAALEQMATEGRFLDAALGYSKLSIEALPPQQNQYSLRTAELLMSGNYVPQASQLLREVDLATLLPELQSRYALLSAEIFLARELPEEALVTLDKLAPQLIAEPETPAAERLRLHRLRATAFEQLNNYLEAAREHIALEPLLVTPEAILANQEAIFTALQALSPEAVQTLQTAAPPDVLSGWLELTNIGRSLGDPTQGDADLATWRERYPEHPALDSVISAVLAARPRVLPLPRQIALILPLNNRFAKAASAIRDGFFAAYYDQQPSVTNSFFNSNFLGIDTPAISIPIVKIYDEGDDPTLIGLVYEQAVDEGAEFVVGPLNKDAVNQITMRSDLPVPLLTLNYSEQRPTQTDETFPLNLFQLSLSPEQEARHAAEKAWMDGQSRAAIITPASVWGERVARAFSERWLQFGGSIVEKQTYDNKQSDYSLPIRRLLNVDESAQRKKTLRRLLKNKIEFIPRRRQDIDFIFMVARPKQARLIRPQLRFHHAPKVPVYATSHSYSGVIHADMDRDMDGVIFSDMPWTLATEGDSHTLKSDIERLWPNASKRYSRLYALGVDAYKIIAELNTLRRDRSNYYQGETGDLYLDVENRLQRRLIWAQFQRGIPRIIKEF
ncbi:MAG: penicillin-binding protein activator [Proteobacteria bacterium]|nr:penicillin-binding protein activator [Pseudomonadota bacterium]